MNAKRQIIAASFCWFIISATSIFAQSPKKVALLVGVESYEKRGFSNLRYAEDDMTALGAELIKQGFDVTILVGSSKDEKRRATGVNIRRVIDQEFIPKLKLLQKSDMSLIALAGHGRHQSVPDGPERKREDHFYCPSDAHDADASTWISISKLIEQVETESSSETNLILVDACRDNPNRGRGVDGKGFTLNRDAVAILFAASYNEQAYEPDSLRHGLFSYYILKGLQGDARDFEGNVTWDSLVGFVKTKVTRESEDLQSKGEITGIQRPNQVGNLRGVSPVLSRVERKTEIEPQLLTAPFSVSQASAAQRAWAKFLKTEVRQSVGNQGIEMVLIPSGEFMMGSSDAERTKFIKEFELKDDVFDDEKPQHRVRITKPIWVSAHEVTVGQFREFVDDTQYKTDAEKNGGSRYWDPEDGEFKGPDPSKTWRDPGFPGFKQTDDHPVTCVSWNDAQAFCKWLSTREGQNYRLLTEAEWEYACRAGTNTAFCSGDDGDSIGQYGNIADKSFEAKYPKWRAINADDGFVFTSPVGRYRSNAFGLYDMHGNVYEWCSDYYDAGAYATSRSDDPVGPKTSEYRVLRGGSWYNDSRYSRSAYRSRNPPDIRNYIVGFRLSRTP
jgi:formylglycine-generating enzyme